jgi:hypothetical protein
MRRNLRCASSSFPSLAARKVSLTMAEALHFTTSLPYSSHQTSQFCHRHDSSALFRRNSVIAAVRRDKLLHSVLSYNHSKLYSDHSRAQNSGTPALPFLTFSDHTYTGAAVLDGFHYTLCN